MLGEEEKRIYFFPCRRAQSLIYSNAEIAVNDICRVFHFVFRRVVQEESERGTEGKRNDGTWGWRHDKETHIARFVILEKQTTPEMSYATTSIACLLPRFDRLPFPALESCEKKKHFLFCLFHVEGELWLIYKFPSFFLLVLQGEARKVSLFSALFAEEIKDNKLYRIGIKMKILLHNIYFGLRVCVSEGASEKERPME